MKTSFARATALLLVCILMLSLVPVTVFANLDGENPDSVPEIEMETIDAPEVEVVTVDPTVTSEGDGIQTPETQVIAVNQTQAIITEQAPVVTPDPVTYSVVYTVGGQVQGQHTGLAAGAGFPAPPSGTDGYTWSYTDESGVAQSFLWTDAARPQTIGERNWELSGAAPVVEPQVTGGSPEDEDKDKDEEGTPVPTRGVTFTASGEDAEGEAVEVSFTVDVPQDADTEEYLLTDEHITAAITGLNGLLQAYGLQFTGWSTPAPAPGVVAENAAFAAETEAADVQPGEGEEEPEEPEEELAQTAQSFLDFYASHEDGVFADPVASYELTAEELADFTAPAVPGYPDETKHVLSAGWSLDGVSAFTDFAGLAASEQAYSFAPVYTVEDYKYHSFYFYKSGNDSEPWVVDDVRVGDGFDPVQDGVPTPTYPGAYEGSEPPAFLHWALVGTDAAFGFAALEAETEPQELEFIAVFDTPQLNAPLESISISPAGRELKNDGGSGQGSMVPFTLMLNPGDANNITGISWEVVDPSIATIVSGAASRTALVSAVKEGSTQIKVTVATEGGGEFTDFARIDVVKASYNITYYSNYPTGAKKFDYSNGNASATLGEPVDTTAVYSVSPGSPHTISAGMGLANSDFMGWNTSPDGTGEAHAPGGVLAAVDGNVNLYATWGPVATAKTQSITVAYYYREGKSGAKTVNKTTTATIDSAGNIRFVLANNQDVFGTGVQSGDRRYLSGWKVRGDGQSYAFNDICELAEGEYTSSGGKITVHVDAVVSTQDKGTVGYAQFFVLKPGETATATSGKYYSVGAGTVNLAEVDKVLKGNQGNIWGSGKNEDFSGDVSKYILTSPDPRAMADLLKISVNEAAGIRWYVVKDQGDGFHVDGVIAERDRYWNVYFYDGDGKLIEKSVVQGGDPVKNFPTGVKNLQSWYDVANSGKAITQLDYVTRDYHIYAKVAGKVSVVGTIDNGGYVTNGSQIITSGKGSQAINFRAAVGYYITDVYVKTGTGTEKRQSGNYVGGTTYTYSAQTKVEKDTLVTVYTAKKGSVLIQVDNKAKTYGDADPTLTVSVTAQGNLEDQTALAKIKAYLEAEGQNRLTRAEGEDVKYGGYTISIADVAALQAAFPTVNMSVGTGKLAISKAPLTVSVDSHTITTGDAPPEYTYQYAGFKFDDDVSAITPGSITCAYRVGSAAGKYPIRLSAGSAGNYIVPSGQGTLTVNQGFDLGSLAVNNVSKTYGNADPAFSFNNWPAAISQDMFNIEWTREGGENVRDGGYAITPTVTVKAEHSGQFSISGAITPGVLTINPKEVTLTAGSLLNQPFDVNNQTVYKVNTYSPSDASWLVDSDELNIHDSFSGLSAYGQRKAPGQSGVLFAAAEDGVALNGAALSFDAAAQALTGSDNYTFTLVPGAISVTPPAAKSLGWSIAGQAITAKYTGSEQENTDFTVTVPGGFTAEGVTVSGAERVNVEDTEETDTNNPVPAGQVFDYASATITYESGLEGEEAVDATGWFAEPAMTPGSIAITPVSVDVSLRVGPAAIRQGGSLTSEEVVYTGFVNGETAAVLHEVSAITSTPQFTAATPGSYAFALSQTDKANYGNYTFTYGASGAAVTQDVEVRQSGGVVYDTNGVAVENAPQDEKAYYSGDTADIDTGDISTGHWSFLGWARSATATAPDTGFGVGDDASHRFTADGEMLTLYAVWDMDWEATGLNFTGTSHIYDGGLYSAAWAEGVTPESLGFGVTYTSAKGTGAAQNPGFDVVDRDESFAVQGYPVDAVVTATLGSRTFVNDTDYSATVTITPAPLTIEIADEQVPFNVAPPAFFSAEVTGLVNGDSEAVLAGQDDWRDAIATTYTKGDPAVEAGYPITYGGEELTAQNYTVSIEPGTLTVEVLTVDISGLATLEDSSKEYGQTDPAQDALNALFSWVSLPDGVSRDWFSVEVTRAEGETVEAAGYTMTANVTVKPEFVNDVALEGSGPTATFAITPAALVLAADNKQVTYGDGAPALTWTLEGLVKNEALGINDEANAPAIAGAALATSYQKNSPVHSGGYAITVENPGTTQNYTITGRPGTLTVAPRAIDLELAKVSVKDTEKVYSEKDPEFSLNWPDGFDINQFTVTFWRASGENVNKYVVSANVSPKMNEVGGYNYTVEGQPASGELKIKQLPLELVPVPGSGKVYGEADPSPLTNVTENYTNVANPKPGFVKDAPVYTLARRAGENAGNYPITISYDKEANKNYYITARPGEFVISPVGAPLVISMGNFSKMYGNADPDAGEVAASVNVANLVGGDTADMLGISVARKPGEDVGSYEYEITYDATALAGNYTGIEVKAGTLTVTKRPVTLYAFNYPTGNDVLYPNSELPQFAAYLDSRTPLAEGDTQLEYSLYLTDYTGEGTPPAGRYAIGFNVDPDAELNRNYLISVVKGTLTIVPAPALPQEPEETPEDSSIPDDSSEDSSIPDSSSTPDGSSGGSSGPDDSSTGGSSGGGTGESTVPATPGTDETSGGTTVSPVVPIATENPTAAAEIAGPALSSAPLPQPNSPLSAPANAAAVPLDNVQNPLAQAGAEHWALLNLMCAVLCATLAVMLIVSMFQRGKKLSAEEREARAAAGESADGRTGKSGVGWRILAILVGVAVPVVFLVTENIRNPMAFTDRWTLLTVLLTMIQVLAMLLMKDARSKPKRVGVDDWDVHVEK